jgi:hypothetical protein
MSTLVTAFTGHPLMRRTVQAMRFLVLLISDTFYPFQHFPPARQQKHESLSPSVKSDLLPIKAENTSTDYSSTNGNVIDSLNVELDEHIYIDTKELCKQIAQELKTHSIPQSIFATRILCRSQGTLSDLLRRPKEWDQLKARWFL